MQPSEPYHEESHNDPNVFSPEGQPPAGHPSYETTGPIYDPTTDPTYDPTAVVPVEEAKEAAPQEDPKDKKKKKDGPGAKSLLFCLVLKNPFFPHYVPKIVEEVEEKKEADGSSDEEGPHPHRFMEDCFQGYPKEKDSSNETHMKDDDLLLEKGFMNKDTPYPSDFWKVIEIIRRLEMRKFNVIPANMVVPHNPATHGHVPPNCYHGWALDYNALILSPDKDELYIKIHGMTDELLKYAELHQIQLRSNPESDGGGMMITYSEQAEHDLRNSIQRNRKRFEAEKEQEKARSENEEQGLFATVVNDALFESSGDEDEDIDGTEEPVEEGGEKKKKKKKKDDGFIFTVPDKMRIVHRMVREGWGYGGCGIQVNEMKNNGILVKHFFPLHNKVYQKDYGIDRWGSFWALLRWHPWFQSTNSLVSYFGEEIALYFLWLKELTLFLPWIAIPGIVAGVLPYFEISKSVVYAVFSVMCVFWGIAWNARWNGLERTFATRYNQDAYVAQEAVRDEYRSSDEFVVYRKDIFDLKFAVPLTLARRGDELLDRYYSNTKRMAARYLVSYPLITLLTAAMVAVLVVINYWRFDNLGNDTVSYASSILSVITSVLFGVIFDKIIGFTNYIENNRTDNDEEEQIVLKSFFFSFFSFYFSMFIIGLYPDADTTNVQRLKELEIQMIIITLVKPMVQNLQESILPWLMTQVRRRIDTFDGVCGMIVSFVTCTPLPLETEGLTELEIDGMMLWKEAQREPYATTAEDYLEIALQFGYMTMFAVTFPWAPIAAFFYNTLEIRVDANKLLNFSQRPVASPANNIGGWSAIFGLLSGLSIVTNSYLIVLVSPAIDNIQMSTNSTALYQTFIGLQYIFLVLAGAWILYGTSTPAYVQKVTTKYAILRDDDARRQARRRKRQMEEGKKRRAEEFQPEDEVIDE